MNVDRPNKKVERRGAPELEELGIASKGAELTQAEIYAAGKLIERALRPRVGYKVYPAEERGVLAILAAYHSQLQRARGKKSKGAAKKRAEYRRNHVDLLLRYVVGKKYREKPTELATVMEIIGWLDDIHIEASDPQVRRDIHAALKRGPLPTW
jgi:hypothetical protein